jgi:NAD(P)-dependent dehydrogenase (short-subunit alcohol dehydrogenase family)
MVDRLMDKVALITGLGSVGPGWGNGKAISVLFAKEGAKIFGVDINGDAAMETQNLVEHEGGICVVRKGDVSKQSDVETTVKECLDTFGRIDILVNNVGIAMVGGPTELDEASWERVINVNFKSVYLYCRYALPVMEQRGSGTIVNIASIAARGWCGVNYGLYAATKGAVIAMTRHIAVQFARKGIRANCVLPGLMNTPLVLAGLTKFYGEEGDVENLIRIRHEQCPMGQMGDAWDTANAALYLASDEAKYVTGTELVVDGGFAVRFA